MSETKTAGSLTVRLNPADNVLVARTDIGEGTELENAGPVAQEDVPSGHKLSATEIRAGEPIVKYGQIIGFAVETIEPGRHVHVHNVTMGEFDRDYAYGQGTTPTDMVDPAARATFEGFRRPSGSVGTRNYLGVLTSVNCSATVARYIAAKASEPPLKRK